jgi:hypothetical protein
MAMKKIILMATLMFITVLFTGSVMAQELMIFPAKGQSEDQMEKDKFECYSWGKKQTGFDPMVIPKATAPPPQQQAQSGGAVRGAAGGALAGAAIGKASGNSRSDGAKYGAAAGAVMGGMRRSGQRQADQKAQEQWEKEQADNYMKNRNDYTRAYGACLEGKGYTVK